MDPTNRAAAAGRSEFGARGSSNAPLLAAGIMVAGGIILAGWAVASAAAENGSLGALLNRHEKAAPAAPLAQAEPKADGAAGATQADPQGGTTTGASTVLPQPADLPAAAKPTVYQIKRGDTLAGISAATGVPIPLLIEQNHIQNPDQIYAGSWLVIPAVR